MRALLTILLGCTLANFVTAPRFVVAQPYSQGDVCTNGRCPISPTQGNPASAGVQIDARAIVRVFNVSGSSRAAGTGTLVDADAEQGLVITCAHLFRDGAATLSVTFSGGRAFGARLLKIDSAADLAALAIAAPGVEPARIAEQSPQRGDPLVSCGYGSNGQLWCNSGQLLGYVTTTGGHGSETLELSGAARFGDSGGPVFNRNHELVAVLFGTNGRVIDGTFCGRIRRFLAGLSPRFRAQQAAAPAKQPAPLPGPVVETPPLVQVPPQSVAPDVGHEKLARLEQLVSRLNQSWQALSAKFEALASAAQQQAEQSSGDPKEVTPGQPPQIELPPGMDPLDQADPIQSIAEPWLSAKLAALLISFGVPGGIAGVAAGAVVWLIMRRAKARLQTQLDRLKAGGGGAATEQNATDNSPVVERHHNQYVAYEITALDKAWAAAHAHVGEKYPGAVPYLKIAESVKDQLLSGNKDSQSS